MASSRQRLAGLVAGIAVGVGSFAVGVAPAQAEVDIYVTDGTHDVNGRMWKTKCEPYSATKRCRTEIQATVVKYEGGKFVQDNGWAFNNLTYAASPRELWKGNPIAGNGVVGGHLTWTAEDGRKWRTECDTAATGQGGCRSYIEASVIAKVGTGFQWRTQWILNNMVRFSATPAPKPTPKPKPTLGPTKWEFLSENDTGDYWLDLKYDGAVIGTKSFPNSLVDDGWNSRNTRTFTNVYETNGQCVTFDAWLGARVDEGGPTPITLRVLIDDKEAKTVEAKQGDAAVHVTLDIRGAKKVSLVGFAPYIASSGEDTGNPVFGDAKMLCAQSPKVDSP